MPNKLWDVMNDLEMVTSKIVSAREIIDTAAEAIQKHDYNKAETLAMAAYEFLGYYLDEFDAKFKLAWQETVVKQKKEENDAWDAVIGERNYYEGNTPLTCDKNDPSPECKGAWNSFWEENYYPEEYKGSTVSSVKYTDEELDAMCDKAELDAEVERIRQEGGYDWTPETKKTLSYDEAVAAGWEMTADGFWIPPQKEDKVKKWVLPVELDPSGEYFVTFPDDLLEASNLKEGDQIEWVDQGDGSYLLRKVTKPLGTDEC